MSAPHEDEADFKPTFTEGYKPGEKKTLDEYTQLDADDEALNRWKASLGITPGSTSAPTGPKVSVLTLELTSPTLPKDKTISFDLTDKNVVESLAKNPINIKEGVEYSVGATFQVNHEVASGLRYIQVVKRAGLKVDKLDAMIGSYGPSTNGKPHSRVFHTEDSPSGIVARSGTYNVRSKVVDDDAESYIDFSWSFKLTKEW